MMENEMLQRFRVLQRRPAAIVLAAVVCAFSAIDVSAAARDPAIAYPTKPIRLLVPFTPGGSQDVTARLITSPVTQALGRNIVVDNRPGSGGLIATQELARASNDGYTLLLSSGAQMSIAPALRRDVGYDPIRSFVHVIHLTDAPLVLIAHPALPVSGIKELIAYSKANPGKMNTASTGNGTYTHLTLELFKLTTGADLTHVPYKGAAPAITDLLGRQIQTMFTVTASAQPYTSTGRLKALGVSAPKRSPAMPDVPTFGEQGVPNFNVSAWVGISAPAGTPQPIVDRLAREFAVALKQPDVRDKLAALGAEPAGTSGEAFTRMVREDVALWAKTVKAAGVKLE
jgi:tripartite-type tricarboxylate transporter receptor subunit TctC